MRNIRVAKRYARSLLEAALVESVVEPVKDSAELFRSAFAQSAPLRALLRNPVIATERKETILQELFSERVHPLFLTFVQLVCRKGREPLLDQIAQQFLELYYAHKGIVVATVFSAVPVSEDLRERIAAFIEQRFHGSPLLEYHVAPDIIGGLIIQREDIRLDASVAGHLERLRRQLLASNGSNIL